MANETKNTELFTKLLIAWGCRKFVNTLDRSKTASENNMYISDEEEDVISKIIWKRTERYGLKLPIECAYIISIGSGGNPGIAIIMYYTLLEKIVKNRNNEPLPRDYIITPDDFSMAFPMKFPDMEDSTQKEGWEKAWDNQKDENGHNNVDKVEYWNKIFV